MTNLKFFDPKIDRDSLMSSYDYDYLAKVKEKFGITDFWATYSWGFNPKTEEEDYKFLLDRLDNFKRAGLKLHAYVQGPNVVYKEFPDANWYAVDQLNRPITYYRGRRVTCLNSSEFRGYKFRQLEEMSRLGFDGIFMDNIQMGQLGIPTYDDSLPFAFAGCYCDHCRRDFKQKFGRDIPNDFEKDKELTKLYLQYRVDVTTEFVGACANIVHKQGLEFGTNSFEPKFNTKYVFGIDLSKLSKIQDYMLFENHSLPSTDGKINNAYIDSVTKDFSCPVFVISYKQGIGHEPAYTQTDLDNIFTEDNRSNFYSCIKGSEYCTNGVWHNLRIDEYNKLNYNEKLLSGFPPKFKDGIERYMMRTPLVRAILKRHYNSLQTFFLESRVGRIVLGGIAYLALH